MRARSGPAGPDVVCGADNLAAHGDRMTTSFSMGDLPESANAEPLWRLQIASIGWTKMFLGWAQSWNGAGATRKDRAPACHSNCEVQATCRRRGEVVRLSGIEGVTGPPSPPARPRSPARGCSGSARPSTVIAGLDPATHLPAAPLPRAQRSPTPNPSLEGRLSPAKGEGLAGLRCRQPGGSGRARGCPVDALALLRRADRSDPAPAVRAVERPVNRFFTSA
jgi:hypothetical protein